ncbi:xanthine permease [Segniliparus rotundus DSM 44985]|uniref:Xanthine permease n=1 Tax=Segniliparus rotundus (strain ATCC BAA-972 / CDC 1076 / CIP 108378 / DSM 44985 / JCM 13578) TaxID=640132 RepID=D6Z9U0_SEGRD|nr:solute carrier family 23 protein [Segniliparus rotundus]ADG98610.1 xanthine permease [Segniliparus rotundus DSM 44985]
MVSVQNASGAPFPKASSPGRPVHPVDEVLAPHKLVAYGLQHVLAFYAGAVLVPILVANALGLTQEQLVHLINADLFTCGIASLIQSVGFGRGWFRFGIRLPLLQGVTFTAVSPMIAIGSAVVAGGAKPVDGLLTIYGSVIVAGLFTILVAPFFARLVRFFPPVVTGSIILVIGVALIPVAAGDVTFGAIVGQNGFYIDPATHQKVAQTAPLDYTVRNAGLLLQNLAYAFGTLAIVLLVQRFSRGFLQTVAVLIGLVAGTAAAFALGDASLGNTASTAWFGVVTPFSFGTPVFSATAIASMVVVMLITMVETTGDSYATGEIVGKRIYPDDIAAAIRADGLATALGGVLNSFPYTAFAENVGLVRLTRIKSRWVVAAAGAMMIVIGLVPKAGSVVASIPNPVLGGAALALFAAVAVAGVQTLQKVDFTDHRNGIVVGTTLGMAGLITAFGAISSVLPHGAQIFFGSGITFGAITAIVLNLLFFHTGGRGQGVAGRPGDNFITLDQVNVMGAKEFDRAFSDIFQGQTWILERSRARRPFKDVLELRGSFQDALLSSSEEEQCSLLRSFPELTSADETGHIHAPDHEARGIAAVDNDVYADIGALTAAYHERFGFPLIVCARDVEHYERVVAHGWSRMANSPVAERVFALMEAAKIFNYRFDDRIADANPIASARHRLASREWR